MRTPWGQSDHVTNVAHGIVFVTTPSHGGYYVSPGLREDMPQDHQSPDGWYEEDCEWSMVILNFPEIVPVEKRKEALTEAKRMTQQYYSDGPRWIRS